MLGDDRSAANAASESDGDEDYIGLGQFVENLARHRADAGNQLGFVGRVDITKPATGQLLLGILTGLIEISPMLNQLGAPHANSAVLVRIIPLRNNHRTTDPKALSGIRQRLSVIACRHRQNAR